MEVAEDEGAKAEEADRDQGFDPAIAGLGVYDTKPEVDGVSCLHGDEGTPDEDGAGVEEAGDDVAEEEYYVAPFGVDVLLHVRLEAL